MQSMKIVKSAIAILIAVFPAVSSSAGEVGDANYGAIFARKNCAWCHGPSLQGFATAPRLAGQKPLYIVSQLWDFAYHKRDNPFSRQYMWCAVANHLSLQTVRDLSVYVAMLHPKPANNGSAALASSGQTLYREGLPTANMPACVACHGPNAEGSGSIPRLGGLSYYYLKRRLEQWGEGYHASAAFPMPRVASKLPEDEIETLASYLSFVN